MGSGKIRHPPVVVPRHVFPGPVSDDFPYGPVNSVQSRAHSFGQFKKHALLKARTQSPCFSYPGLVRAIQSGGSADLSSFGGDCVGWLPE